MSDQPELVCARCQPLETRIAELEQALRSMSDELEERAGELAGARGTLRTVERKLRLAEMKADKHDDDNPDTKKIKGLQEYWKVQTGNKGARISMRSKRTKLVIEQFRTYKADELMEAISGVALLPYKRYGRRYVRGVDEDLKNSMFDCIGTDDWIDENRKIFHRARAGGHNNPTAIMNAADHHEATATALYSVLPWLVGRTEEERTVTLAAVQEADAAFAEIDRMAA